MISVVIFLIGAQAVLAVCVNSMTMSRRAEYAYTAYNLAKNHMERLRLYSFSALSSGAETGTVLDANGNPDTSGSFTRTTAISTNYQGNANLTQATVTVSYTLRGVQNASQCQLSYVFFNYNGAVG